METAFDRIDVRFAYQGLRVDPNTQVPENLRSVQIISWDLVQVEKIIIARAFGRNQGAEYSQFDGC